MPTLFRILFVLFPAFLAAATEAPYFEVRSPGASVDQLPLKSTVAHASLGLGFAEVTVVQTYRNEGTVEIDATYLFPAGEEAAVHGVTMTVGERRIEAVIKEKEEAKKTFEAAKAAGKTAALLEARRPNIFSMSLARIRPGDTVSVELRYIERIHLDGGQFGWVFPTTIGPRYGGAGEDEPSPAIRPVVPVEPEFALTVDLQAGFPVGTMTSPSHQVEWSHAPNGAQLRLARNEGPQMNRDFILRYTLMGESTKPRLLIQEWRGQRYLAVNWMPPARSERPTESIPREFVFVVDVSGSMSGFPLETAQRLVGELLRELRPVDSFNLILFSGANKQLAPQPLAATPENIARGAAFLNAPGGGGGTELLPALQQALAMPAAPNLARTFVVVTDGYVTVEAEAYALVFKNLGQAALFPFGIGSSVNRDLIARLARAGRTRPAIIEGPEHAFQRAAEFRRRIDTPLLAGTKLEWAGAGTLHPLPRTAPAYSEQPWSFVTRLEGVADGKLIFSGNADQGAFRQELHLRDAERLPDGPLLAQAWARDQLEALSDLMALGVDSAGAKRAIIALGLGYNLLTPFTSFVAVDTVVRPTAGPGQHVTQPNALPAGMNSAAMGEAVPGAPEPSTWAMLLVSSGLLGRWWIRRRKGESA